MQRRCAARVWTILTLAVFLNGALAAAALPSGTNDTLPRASVGEGAAAAGSGGSGGAGGAGGAAAEHESDSSLVVSNEVTAAAAAAAVGEQSGVSVSASSSLTPLTVTSEEQNSLVVEQEVELPLSSASAEAAALPSPLPSPASSSSPPASAVSTPVPQSLPSVSSPSSSLSAPSPDSSIVISVVSSISTSQLPATCESRTINYITHFLPQQCAKSSWSRAVIAASTGIAEGAADGQGKDASQGKAEKDGEKATIGGETSPKEGGAGATTAAAGGDSTATDAGSASTTAVAAAQDEQDVDSPLDNANFLSFEEWKKQNLAKAGQSPDNLGQGSGAAGQAGELRERPDLNNALDSLGEDAEIELDFNVFVGPAPQPRAPTGRAKRTTSRGDAGVEGSSTDGAEEEPAGPGGVAQRSKDAGRTSRERSNYASFDCAATVLKTNPRCKSPNSILVENKDSYMLNECATKDKFFIVEMCDDILVDTVVLSNYEFFSSSFRTFRVSVADRYPVKADKWRELGVFEARNTREIQAFAVTHPQIWARFLRIDFLTHYGQEYYCPVSLLRVHGKTMMDEYRHDESVARGEEDLAEMPVTEDIVEEVVEPVTEGVPPQPEEKPAVAVSVEETQAAPNVTEEQAPPTTSEVSEPVGSGATATKSIVDPAVPKGKAKPSRDKRSPEPSPPETIDPPRQESGGTGGTNDAAAGGVDKAPPNGNAAKSESQRAAKAVVSPSAKQQTATQESAASSGKANSSDSTAAPNGASGATSASSSSSSGKPVQSSQEGVKPSTQIHIPHPANPPTQESFFKSVNKRLQQLEVNSTLSLQYIEEQSRILRDAFQKVEKRQLSKTENFLANLNTTVMQELREFRNQYDLLWQSTVLELESQRERSHAEIIALSQRLTLLADELVFQKRMIVFQMTLLLLCLILILGVRSGVSSVDFPLVQQVMARGQKWRSPIRSTTTVDHLFSNNNSPWESPPNSPDYPPRSNSVGGRGGLGAAVAAAAAAAELRHRHAASPSSNGRSGDGLAVSGPGSPGSSDDASRVGTPVLNGRTSPTLHVSPPTPPTSSPLDEDPGSRGTTSSSGSGSSGSGSGRGGRRSAAADGRASPRPRFVEMDEHRPESPDSPELLRRTQSGPTTPRGTRDGFGWEEVSEEDPGMGTPGNTTGEDDEEDEED